MDVSDQFHVFREEARTAGLLDSPQDSDTGAKDLGFGINDDSTLRRFFVARNKKPSDALAQLRAAHRIRETNDVNKFYCEVDDEVFEETRNLYPQWTGRLCKKGQPVCVFDTAALSSERMAAYASSSAKLKTHAAAERGKDGISVEVLRSFVIFDYFTRFVMPLCSTIGVESGTSITVTKLVLLVDVSSLGLSQLWRLKGYLQDFIRTLATSFPEILDKVFITGASAGFPTIWNLVKRWADPKTVSKFHILSSAEAMDVTSAHIDIENIPRKYGGLLEFNMGMQPMLDTRIEQVLRWTNEQEAVFPQGPVKWRAGTKGNMTAVAVGCVHGVARDEEFATVPAPSFL